VPLTWLFAAIAVAGLALGAISLVALRRAEAHPGMARRLAGPPQAKVGTLLDGELPDRPIRVSGRVRCPEPLDTGDGEKLVAFHRDVDVRVGGRWRSLERLRETRSFDLWDHDGSLRVDPAFAAEPLVTIPKVWRGSPAVLEEPHASAIARLEERHGPVAEARATTRTLAITDRLLVLAQPTRDEAGEVRLDPPSGGFLITNLELGDAMRILAGRSRRAATGGVIGIALAIALVGIGVAGTAAALVLNA
jgi:hypothetical protein